MFFVAFNQEERSQDIKFCSFYTKLPLGIKLIFFISFLAMIYCVFSSNGFLIANVPSRTVPHSQYWRIFTAPFATIDGVYGVMSIVIAFWWLISLFPSYERKYSTIHLLLEIFVQNMLIQISYCVVVELLIKNTFFYETYTDFFFTMGWIPIVIIWIFKFTGESMNEKINFCFLPFLVKNKYLAWILSGTMIVLTNQRIALVIATLLGAIQFHLFHRSCIRLPLCFHVCMEKPFLLLAFCCSSFVKIEQVRENLELVCGMVPEQQLLQESVDITETDKMKLGEMGKKDSEIEMAEDMGVK